MSKAQRKKGANYERRTAHFYKRHGFKNAQRHLEFQTSHATKGVDLENTTPFLVQCKKGKQVPITIYKYIEQVQQSNNQYPVVHCQRDNQKGLVILYEDDWGEILHMLKNHLII